MNGHLLDSHALVWWWINSDQLGPKAREIIEAGGDMFVSTASLWEIAIKSAAGKLPEIVNFRGEYLALMRQNGFINLAVETDIAIHAAYLPGEHRDPFDRLIAAQAMLSDLTVITRDREIASFGCRTIW